MQTQPEANLVSDASRIGSPSIGYAHSSPALRLQARKMWPAAEGAAFGSTRLTVGTADGPDRSSSSHRTASFPART
jgi:hypothetical protein